MGLRSACPISRALMDHWAKEIVKIEERAVALSTLNPIMSEPLVSYLMAKYVDDVLKAAEQLRRWDQTHRAKKPMIWTLAPTWSK